MAQYRVSVSVIKASGGRSALAASAYINGAKNDEAASLQAANAYLSGAEVESFDYTRKRGILHTEFVGPDKYWKSKTTPDRIGFWDDVVEFERKNNRRYYDKKTGSPKASLAREHKVNLPHELPLECNIKLARAYSLEYRRRYGIAGEFAVHAPPKNGDSRNIHFHFLHNERAVDEDGSFEDKKASFTRGNRAQELIAMREWWATRVQRELKKRGIKEQFDHRSNEDRGIKRAPTKHLGPTLSKLERAGIPTAVGEYNRSVKHFSDNRNRSLKKHEVEEIKIRSRIARELGERKSGAHSRNREDATRKRRAYRRKRAIVHFTNEIQGLLNGWDKSIEEYNKIVRKAISAISVIIEKRQVRLYEQIPSRKKRKFKR